MCGILLSKRIYLSLQSQVKMFPIKISSTHARLFVCIVFQIIIYMNDGQDGSRPRTEYKFVYFYLPFKNFQSTCEISQNVCAKSRAKGSGHGLLHRKLTVSWMLVSIAVMKSNTESIFKYPFIPDRLFWDL